LNSEFFVLGITDKNIVINALKISRTLLIICRSYVLSISVGCFVVMTITTAFNYNLRDFFLFGISWAFVGMIWSYQCGSIALYFPCYYFIVSYYLNLRLISFLKHVKSFKNFVKFSKEVDSFKVRELLIEHNDLCIQIYNYNKYWKKYLSLTFLIFLSLICFQIYLVFFAPMNWYLRLIYTIGLTAHTFLVSIVTYSASSVSHFNQILFRELNSILVQSEFPVFIKLKVSCGKKTFKL